MYPTSTQEQQMLLRCAHARYVWNLAVEQHAQVAQGRAGFCRAVSSAHRGPARQ
ncbi:helix-turn-helix domain-containing protein [Streptomyces sp. NBC_00151]|uniref:helix-turn-helix domain-containing protein n=1 Tax=Streptomyces sp. NBC_00151 TaxID=2975669 RepID=UPI002DDBFB7D|nr:helix-turn-helix domain-containing protein [Streptomyces sp. NBC_00151]